MKKFFNTPTGTFVKVFIAAVLTAYLVMLTNGHSLFSWDKVMVESLLKAALISTIPILINWMNPEDKRYGRGVESKEDEPPYQG